MNNIARSKIFMIAGGIVLSLLVVAIVIIAIFIPKEPDVEPENKTVEEVQEDNIKEYYAGENGDEEAADVGSPEDPDAPPEKVYENSYEDDFGYLSISDHESAKDNPANTVYDDEWASTKWTELNCDLTTKLTVSEKALESLTEFRTDLTHVGSDMSSQLITNVDYIMSKLSNSRGKRLPGEVKNITNLNCQMKTEEVRL